MSKKVKREIEIIDAIIMFILVGIVPFLVFYQNANIPAEQLALVDKPYDYFNYIKVNVILLMSVVILFIKGADFIGTFGTFILSDKVKKWLKNPYVIFGTLMILTTFLSFLFSDYKQTALHGALERFESIWVHFAYIIIFAFSVDFFKKKSSFKIFSSAVLTATFIVGLVGTLQFLGIQILNSPIIANITQSAIPSEFQVNFDLSGSYSTLYNINTSASYSLFMIFVLIIIILKSDALYDRVLACCNIVLLTITFLNSKSEASYIALAVSLVFMAGLTIFTLLIKGKKKEGMVALGLVLVIGLGGFVSYLSMESLNTKVNNVISSAIGPVTIFSDWEQEDNIIHLYNYKDDDFALVSYADYFEINENGNLLNTYKLSEFVDDNLVTENFGTVNLKQVAIEGYEYNFLQINDSNVYFLLGEEPAIISSAAYLQEENYDSFGFEKHYGMFTHRGFIWSRSLPMLFDSLLIGKGADTFMLEFPNYDYMGRWFANFPEATLIDKPHNIYLGMGISNGCIYLLSFLGICTLVLIEKFKLLINKDNEKVNYAAVIVYLGGFSAYLVNGLSTDNIVVIVMLFWVYLGIGRKFFIKEDDNKDLNVSKK